MTLLRKVIHVELNEPYNDKHHWYFGSILAHTSLWNVLSKNGKYTTKTATIRLGVLHTKQTNRGKKGNGKGG